MDTVAAEAGLVAAALTGRHRLAHLHFGGGSPSILKPAEIAAFAGHIRRLFDVDDRFEFAVEIDPRDIDEQAIRAWAAAGATRASIGVQDFDPAGAAGDQSHPEFRPDRGLRGAAAGGGYQGDQHRPDLRPAKSDGGDSAVHRRAGGRAAAEPGGDLRLCPCALDEAPSAAAAGGGAAGHAGAAGPGGGCGGGAGRCRLCARRAGSLRPAGGRHGAGGRRRAARPQLPGLHHRCGAGADRPRRVVHRHPAPGLCAERDRSQALYARQSKKAASPRHAVLRSAQKTKCAGRSSSG